MTPSTKQKWVFWLENKTVITPRLVTEYIEKMLYYNSQSDLLLSPLSSSSSSIDHKPKLHKPKCFFVNHNRKGYKH